MFRQRRVPCRNGSECRFLKQNRCHFYHPAEHRNSSSSSNCSPSALQQRRLRSIQAYVLRPSRERQCQRLRLQRQRQYQLNMQRLRQIYGLNRSSLANLNKQKQQFPWFFQKNKTFNLMQNKSPQLQRFNQCPICFEDFLEEIKLQRQKIQQKNKLKALKEQDQLDSSWLEYLNDQQSQQSEQLNKQVLLIELYCGHIYHKDCVQNWLKTNSKCAVCRKDFRNHQQYSKWDKDYKKRFNCKQQNNVQRQTSAIYNRISQNSLSSFSILSSLNQQIQSSRGQMQNDHIQYQLSDEQQNHEWDQDSIDYDNDEAQRYDMFFYGQHEDQEYRLGNDNNSDQDW